jgi:hypothetical protein
MSALANQNPESEVLNSFGQGSEAYKERFEQIVREVPLAIQRLVGA